MCIHGILFNQVLFKNLWQLFHKVEGTDEVSKNGILMKEKAISLQNSAIRIVFPTAYQAS